MNFGGTTMKKGQIPLIALLRWSLCFTGSIFMIVSVCMLTALQDLHVDDFPAHSRSVTVEDWPHPFIHIVNTRFMQHQADLVELAKARLVLFDTFCLGSMLGQSLLQGLDTPPLLWIIKTDPDLNESLLKDLISLIKPYPFIYLVASNLNYGIGIHPGGWRGGEAGDGVLQSRVYTGNMTLFRQAHAARETHGILETRLDADDGLHVRYLETIQKEALARLQYSANESRPLRWMYWCSMNHLDWTPTPPFATGSEFEEYGAFVPFRSSNRCITAGITLGVSVGQNESSLPRFMHHELYSELRIDKKRATCNGEKCLHMIDKPLLGAMRSRTATSAGMRDVTIGQDEYIKRIEKHAVPLSSKHLVDALEKGFNVSVLKTIQANRYMQQHVAAIAADNLQGQCTHGHSCKNSTRDALEELLRAAATNTLTR
jgi:hypothetical protein